MSDHNKTRKNLVVPCRAAFEKKKTAVMKGA